MNRHTSSSQRPVLVQAKFEPSRLAGACTADAYEYIVPLVQRPLPQKHLALPVPAFTHATCQATRACSANVIH